MPVHPAQPSMHQPKRSNTRTQSTTTMLRTVMPAPCCPGHHSLVFLSSVVWLAVADGVRAAAVIVVSVGGCVLVVVVLGIFCIVHIVTLTIINRDVLPGVFLL